MTRPLARIIAVLIVVIFGAACARPVPARPQWQTVGELARPRAYASAVALANGKILVVGGLNNDDANVMNVESELIDPQGGSVTVLPGHLLGRLHQTITRAWEDVVVVAGGVEWMGAWWSPVDRVDVFLPSTRSWVLAQPLLQARSDHAATTLHDGRVLVTGGNAGTRMLTSTEIYDPQVDRWTEAAPMPRGRTQHTAVRLLDGRVLVAGGLDTDGAATATTFVYDPRLDQWSHGPDLTFPRIQHVAVALPNGDVLIAGGDGPASGTSERYDARTREFVPSGTLAYPRLVAQAAALPDGRVIISGGLPPRIREFTPLRSVEMWDPKSERWSDLPPAPTARAWANIVIIGTTVYQLSGTGEGEAAYRTVERLSLN